MAKARKVELPTELDAPFAVPEDATVAELTEMIAQANKDANGLVAEGTKGSATERVAQANWYIAAIEAMEGRQDEIVANDAAEAAALDDVRARLASQASGPEDDEDETENDDEVTDGDGEAADDAGVVETGTVTDAPADAALVAGAGARRSAVAAAARGGQPSSRKARARVDTKQTEAAYMTAGGGANIEAGSRINWDEMGTIAQSRFGSLPKGDNSPRSQLSLGRINTPMTDERLVASAGPGDYAEADEAIAWATSMERIKEQTGEDSLTAAGWCAPSDTWYDLIDVSTDDGMIDIAGFTTTRGGVRFSNGPDFTTVYNAGFLFTQTEAQNIAGTTKASVNIPCPSWTDNRLKVDGLYLTGDILTEKGYPEGYTDYTRKSLKAFAHYVNANTIADMVALMTAVDFATGLKPTLAVTTELLGAIEITITDMRYKNRMSETAPMEVVLPLWAKGTIRSDIAKRQGVDNAAKLSDADITDYFAVRGASVQWVYDWQDAFTGISGGFGGATAVTAWPTSVDVMVYPQGGMVRTLSPVIELSAVYDSTLLHTNQYVALFMEQARLVLKRTFDARKLTIPVTVSGATGLPIDYTVAGRQPTV